MQKGLSKETAIGRFGRFRKKAGNHTWGLNTCTVQGNMIFAFGRQGIPVGAPALGLSYTQEQCAASWTGCTWNVQSEDLRYTADYRLTLPGPLYTLDGKEWGFDFALGASSETLIAYPEGKAFSVGRDLVKAPQVFTTTTGFGRILFVSSEAVEALEVISYEHWRFRFSESGARIMILPLLSEADVPATEEKVNALISLVQHPPLECTEYFKVTGDRVLIESQFADEKGQPSEWAPQAPVTALYENKKNLQEISDGLQLLQTVSGPFCVEKGSRTRRRLDISWHRFGMEPGRLDKIKVDPLPLELAFPGDWTWDESCPMDQLLSLRVWAQRAKVLDEKTWKAILERTPLPGAEKFRAHLMRVEEPVSGRSWMKDHALFYHCGDVSYDADWYNGLMLSGLKRAMECADLKLGEAARELAAELKPERKELTDYYEIFHDWSLGVAWTDPRGEIFNWDCGHNGLEGLLAEAHFCKAEGDGERSDLMLYLAARSSVIFCATSEFSAWTRRLHVLEKDCEEEESFGVNHFMEWRGADAVDASNKQPYMSAGDFPEFSALLKKFGPVEELKRMTKRYCEKYPERYSDWLAFRMGKERADKVRSQKVQGEVHQANREQNAIFYHVSPDTALRLWTLDEDPEFVMGLYGEQMPAAPRILCEGRFVLKERS